MSKNVISSSIDSVLKTILSLSFLFLNVYIVSVGKDKVSVGKDNVSKENCYWQQEHHVTKNFIRQKMVKLNSDMLTFCFTS